MRGSRPAGEAKIGLLARGATAGLLGAGAARGARSGVMKKLGLCVEATAAVGVVGLALVCGVTTELIGVLGLCGVDCGVSSSLGASNVGTSPQAGGASAKASPKRTAGCRRRGALSGVMKKRGRCDEAVGVKSSLGASNIEIGRAHV